MRYAEEALNRLEQNTSLLSTGRVDLRHKITADQLGTSPEEVTEQVNRLIEGFLQAFRVVDKALTHMSVKESLHVLQLQRQTAVIEQQRVQTDALSTNVTELAHGVTAVAQEAAATAAASQRMEDVGAHTMTLVEAALSAVQQLRNQALLSQETVTGLLENVQRTHNRLLGIRRLAQTSRLLALNAAIQAAHANSPAFSVVAQEMRRLADQTESLATQVEADLKQMAEAGEQSSLALKEMAATAESTAADAGQAAQGLGEMKGLIADTSMRAQSIAAVAQEQAAGTESLAASAEALSRDINASAESLALTSELSTSDLVEQAHAALSHYVIGSHNDEMRTLAEQVAVSLELAVESCVAEQGIAPDLLWRTDYRELKGSSVRRLQRLFDVSKVPPEGFTPPKFETSYDSLVDEALIRVLDQAVQRREVSFISVLDINGFTIAQPSTACRDWTGIPEQDLTGNRIKRFFSDKASLKAARVGFPSYYLDRERLSWQEQALARMWQEPRPAVRPLLLQSFARDTGEVVMDLAVPLYVVGRRWAVVRMGYSPRI